MAAVSEAHFELDGFAFGGSGLGPIFVENYDTGVAEWLNQDQDHPTRNQRFFGRDTLAGPTWTFKLNIISPTEGSTAALEALNALEQLMGYWRAQANSRIPGAVSVLRYTRAGRTRKVYGRPRRFFYDPNRVKRGLITAECEFVTRDPYHYDDTDNQVDLSIAPAMTGGLLLPATLPASIASSEDRQGVIPNSEADAPSPAVLTIYGPISNPYVTGKGWRIGFSGQTIAAGDRVTINSYDSSVMHNKQGTWAGKLDRNTLVSDVMIQKGSSEITFGGSDTTGTARAVLTWAPAHNGL